MPIPQLSQKKYHRSWKDKQGSYGPQKKQRSFNKNNSSWWKKLIFNKKIFLGLGLIVFFFILSGIGVIAWMSQDLPDPNHLMERDIAQSTKIYDRTGEILLYEMHGEQQRTLKKLDEIPDHVKQAIIAMEDRNFYRHPGFSLLAISRTIVTDLVRREMAGASTITQQLVKNAILTPEKTFTRKIKELILAYRIEQGFSKDEILKMYLNEIPFGGTTYGVEAASRHYFDKSVEDVSLGEAAILAALPQAPSFYSPYGPNKEILIQRKNYILNLMHEQGYITEGEMKEAQEEKIHFRAPTSNIVAPHFVMYVKSILSQKYGQKMLEQGGLEIHTSLDVYKQKIAEETVSKKAKENAEKHNASNAGLVSIDPKTGEILAMVGSKNYFSQEIEGEFNVATANRQPGSSLKPIVYASLFEKGFTPNTKVFDVVTNFSQNPDNPYEPKNYNLKEHGLISLRDSLAGSLNIPAVKALYLAEMENVFSLLNKLGYSGFNDKDRYGLSLVLGGGEVKLLEHTNAFSAFSREGLINPITPVLKIKGPDGRVIEEAEDRQEKVLDPKVARMINSILSDEGARSFTFGNDRNLSLENRQVAVKTGTTNNYRDAWTIGYTPSLVTGVWAGNNDNSQMSRGSGGSRVAAPIWNEYMQRVLGDTPREKFRELGDIKTGKPAIDGELEFEKTVEIDTISGLLATEYTPQKYIEEKTYTYMPRSILYYVDKKDPLGSEPKESSTDPLFENWERAVQRYAEESEDYSTSSIPTEYDNVHKPEFRPELTLLYPKDGEIIEEGFLEAEVEVSAPRGVNSVSYYINDQLLREVRNYPFNLNRDISFLENGYHELKLVACDDVGNCTEKSIDFNLILEERDLNNEELGVSWLSPRDGTSLNKFNFPIDLEFSVNPVERISKINVFFKEKGTSTDGETIYSRVAPEEEVVEIGWEKPPRAGVYDVIIESHLWGGEVKRSKALTIVVNE